MTISESKYISYENLYISQSENLTVYMGYKLKLTKSEYTVLKVLAQNVATPLSSEKISLATGCEISPKNVAFHVHNINKKAKNISNRILIKNIAKIGYFLK